MLFALGQRWISDTESDLGLGTVVQIEGRMITILFPATGESRIFAHEQAPLTRVRFNPGDNVQGPEEWQIEVSKVTEDDNMLLTYIGKRSDTGEEIELRETLLHHNIRFNKPQDRLFAGQIDRIDRFSMRYQARQLKFSSDTSDVLGLQGARVGLIPHQLWIAHEVGKRHAPRVLLADEVGLGKTIEAGMIIHQQLLTGRAERVLIVLPDSLRHQWLVEMLRRFNLHFAIFDEERCIEAYADADNPFDTEQLVICSMDLLRKKKRLEQALDANWDLLVVDEAHHLEWHPDKPSRGYQVVEALAAEIPGVLLLTATPDQLGHESHFARLRLLDPDRFYDYQNFLAEEQDYQKVADAATAIELGAVAGEPADNLKQLLGVDVQATIDLLNSTEEQIVISAQQSLLQQLLDRHGTGRVLFRNSRASVAGFPQRLFNPHPLALPNEYKTAQKVAAMMGGQQSAEVKAVQALTPEKVYQDFEGDSSGWWRFDPRVDWLIDFLKENKREKVLIIAAKAETALALEEALRTREGIATTVFHEGMSIIERDRAGAYFAQEEAGAQALICSEIGSEGRNFQFASQLVLFDLPLNPDLLEQRIGRLDRIGQQNDVNIHVPYFADTAQQTLMDWYHQGLNSFCQTTPSGHIIYKEFADELLEQLCLQDETGINSLIEQTAERQQQLTEAMQKGRDKLLELNSHGGDKAKALTERLASLDGDVNFIAMVLKMWDIIGVEQQDKGENAIVLTPTEHMLFPTYPGLPEDGITVTFDREVALSRDDIALITPEHPLVLGGLDLILTSESGSTSVALLKNKALPAGTVFLEAMYVADASAPKSTQLFRYLPATPIRVLLDKNGNDIAANIDYQSFDNQLSSVNRHMASKLVNAAQVLIHPMLAQAEAAAAKQMQTLIDDAKANMHHSLHTELQRLTALKQVNPNIRQSEIDYLAKQISQLDDLIDGAQLQLDALRVVMVSHN